MRTTTKKIAEALMRRLPESTKAELLNELLSTVMDLSETLEQTTGPEKYLMGMDLGLLNDLHGQIESNFALDCPNYCG